MDRSLLRRGGLRAEIDALATMIAAAAVMADRLRSDAASHLLRRALAALPGVTDAAGAGPSQQR